jgi:hypothetical protein
MTLDELVILTTKTEIVEEARQFTFGMRDRYQIRRAGIRAVVAALRRHFYEKTGTWEPTWPQVEVDLLFEDILAKAEHSDADQTEQRDVDRDGVEAEPPALQTKTVPLTGVKKTVRPDVVFEPSDPTPAAAPVCEWTFKESGLAVISCSKYPIGPYPSHGDFCTHCGKPVSFKSEAAR